MILDDDDDDDDDNDDSNSTSDRGISSDLKADGTGRELGPSPITPYPGSSNHCVTTVRSCTKAVSSVFVSARRFICCYVTCIKQRCNETGNSILRSKTITVIVFYELISFEMFKD